jgi:hypothetical protein
MVGLREAASWLNWLEISTRQLIRKSWFVAAVYRLVPLLLEHEGVPGETVQTIYKEA